MANTETISKEQVKNLLHLIAETDTDIEQFCKRGKVEALPDILAADYENVVYLLEEKKKRMKARAVLENSEPAQGNKAEGISISDAAKFLCSEDNMWAIHDACDGICKVYRFRDVLDRLALPATPIPEAEA